MVLKLIGKTKDRFLATPFRIADSSIELKFTILMFRSILFELKFNSNKVSMRMSIFLFDST